MVQLPLACVGALATGCAPHAVDAVDASQLADSTVTVADASPLDAAQQPGEDGSTPAEAGPSTEPESTTSTEHDASRAEDAPLDSGPAEPPTDSSTPDAGVVDAGADASRPGVFMPPYILGADITITLEDEHWGATYTDQGRSKSLEQLLKDHGFNFIRIDTFVNPGDPGGYAVGKPEPFRDLAHTIELAKRVKAIGLGFMLNLHYADTWTNPGAHAAPAAWASLSLSALETRVYEYTRDALTRLRAEGAMPDIVSVGNEITNGMLWEQGRIANNDFTNLARLLKAGIRAVREIEPAISIQLHIERCHDLAASQWWLDGVLGQGVAFDILGQSCYASGPNGVAGYHGTPAQWKSTFAAQAARYPKLKFMIAEYSAQQRAANDIMRALPDGRGLGTFNWDPTRAYDTHPNDPLFRTDGAWNRFVAIPEKMALYERMAADYQLR